MVGEYEWGQKQEKLEKYLDQAVESVEPALDESDDRDIYHTYCTKEMTMA